MGEGLGRSAHRRLRHRWHQGLLLELDQDGRAGGADLDFARRAERLCADEVAISRPQARVRHDAVRLLHPVPIGHHSDGGHSRHAWQLWQSADRSHRLFVRLRQSDGQPGDRSRHLRPRLHDAVLPQLLRGVPDRTGQGGDDRRRRASSRYSGASCCRIRRRFSSSLSSISSPTSGTTSCSARLSPPATSRR